MKDLFVLTLRYPFVYLGDRGFFFIDRQQKKGTANLILVITNTYNNLIYDRVIHLF